MFIGDRIPLYFIVYTKSFSKILFIYLLNVICIIILFLLIHIHSIKIEK
jgi:hypothetical protein